ncbi:MAG: sulfotransferase [Alphaproteobacteria bacterium]
MQARGLARRGKHDQAERILKQAIRADPGHAASQHEYGLLKLGQGRVDEALGPLRRSAELAPDEASYHNSLGTALYQLDRLSEAEAAYRLAIEIRPDYPKALNNLGALLRLGGRAAEAEVVCRRALDIKPDYVEAYYTLARAHRFRPGDPLIGELARQLARQPRNGAERGHLLVALGKAHDDIGLYDKAFDYYRKANRDRARRARFDLAAQRARIEAIKSAFPEPALCPDRTPGPVTPVFVVGMPRSGKTLVESLLARHAAVIALGEDQELRQAMGGVLRASANTEPYPACLRSLTPAQIRAAGAQYLEAVRRRRQLPGARFYVNTLPGNYDQLGLIFRAFPSVKVIDCTRDPLDQCLFIYFKIFTTGHEYSSDLEDLAAYYRNYRDMMAHWQRLYGERILTVDYETLVRAPQETGRRLYAHCGLDFPPAGLDAEFTTGQIGHARHYQAQLAPLHAALGSLS